MVNLSKAIVFDMDETLGHFYGIGLLLEGIERLLHKKLSKLEIFNIFDLYNDIFRPKILEMLRIINKLKTKHKVKTILYTNNMGPREWTIAIKEYIEYKLKFKIFDKIISAWKVGGEIIEKCRTGYGKKYIDLLNCANLTRDTKILFFDDQSHHAMFDLKVDYHVVPPYYSFSSPIKIVETFIKSNLTIIKKLNKTGHNKKFIKEFLKGIIRSGFYEIRTDMYKNKFTKEYYNKYSTNMLKYIKLFILDKTTAMVSRLDSPFTRKTDKRPLKGTLTSNKTTRTYKLSLRKTKRRKLKIRKQNKKIKKKKVTKKRNKKTHNKRKLKLK